MAACPNCGFTENALAAASLRPPERVLIDRWPLVWRRAKPLDVVALHAPAAEGLAVKRVAAAGPGELEIHDGDLRLDGKWLRKSPAELRKVRLLVHDDAFPPRKTDGLPLRWRPIRDYSHWQANGVSYHLPASAASAGDWDRLAYEHWACTANPRLRGVSAEVLDNDPYNQGETTRELNPVADVFLSCRLKATGAGRLALAATDGEQRFELAIEPQRSVVLRCNGVTLLELPQKLQLSQAAVEIEFGLCDRQVFLSAGGRTIVRFPDERRSGARPVVKRPLAIGAQELDVELSHLRVWRDIYYLDANGRAGNWQSGPLTSGQLIVLGDNEPVSIDSRQWQPAAVPESAVIGLVNQPFWADHR